MNRTVCLSKTMMNYCQNSEILIHSTNKYVMSSAFHFVSPLCWHGKILFSVEEFILNFILFKKTSP